jgi:hypothetical protein
MLHCVGLTLFRSIGVSGDGPPASRFMGTLVLFRMAAIFAFWISQQLLLARRGKAFFSARVCLPLAS